MNKLMALCLLFILIPTVAGLGISPGKRTFDFEPDGTKTVEITVHNNDEKEFECLIQKRGGLSKYIELSKESLDFKPNEKTKSFTYTIRYPEELEEPGVHSGEIAVKELLKAKEGEEVVIKPGLMVISKLYVKVPYPDKYAKGEIITDDVKRGEELDVFIRFSNVGSETISNAVADIHVLGPGGEVLKKLKSNSVSLEPQRTRELRAKFDTTELKPGEYKLEADVNYDNKRLNLKGGFSIEDFLVKLLSVAVDSFNLGEIADFEITLKNIGNRIVEGVSADLFLRDKSGKTLADVNSYKISMSPGDIKETKIYWDTANIDVGDYYGKLSISYGDDKLTKNVLTKVEQDKIDVQVGNDITGMAVADTKGGASGNNTWVVMLGVIVVLLVLLVLQTLRGRSGKNN